MADMVWIRGSRIPEYDLRHAWSSAQRAMANTRQPQQPVDYHFPLFADCKRRETAVPASCIVN
jgi:hypothetical protein